MTPIAPPRRLAPDESSLFAPIRLLVFDFDGVFTDNSVLVSEDGVESVRCWRSDGLGLDRVRQLGIEMAVVSTESNPVVAVRCKKLKLTVFQGCARKHKQVAAMIEERGLDWAAVAYMGNDINDSECLKAAGLSIVVADVDPAVAPLARLTTARPGGYGAVREVCDWIWDARAAS